MSVETPEQLEALRRVGRVVATTIAAVRAASVPGVCTRDLDRVAQAVFARFGARSGPVLTYDYPGSICLSVDAQIVHGVPGGRQLSAGQLLSIDVAAELGGFHADAATTIAVGGSDRAARRLLAAGRAALRAGIQAARPGARLREVGAAIERAAEVRGFHIARELTGHGIGLRMREPPTVFNWPSPDRAADVRLTPGLVLTIEPMLVAGKPELVVEPDGWTIRDLHGALSTHEEHTIVVQPERALILTAPV